MGQVYYVDPTNGRDEWDGLCRFTPKKNYRTIHPQPGDTVLFRRGSVMREVLHLRPGAEGARITYSSYGEGEKPRILGSLDMSAPECWAEESPILWVCTKELPYEICNIVLNDGTLWGNLRWEVADLKHQGEWYYSHMGKIPVEPDGEPQKLYLYSEKNPGEYYSGIECAQRINVLAGIESEWGLHHVTVQDLAFENGGVCGFQCWIPSEITIQRCDFRNIGGAVWSRERRIRCGNAVEFWDGSDNILVEDCYFEEIYDSAITHQGSSRCAPSRRLTFRNNVFYKYGMAAYEVRDLLPIDSHFDNNLCVQAGGGFAMQGEEPPRQSEIWPQPMGHHIFLWRIPKATEQGLLTVRGNIFCEAPYGAAIYSIISAEAEAQMVVEDNLYCKSTGGLFWRWGGKDYTVEEFARYQEESGKDIRSCVCDETACEEAMVRAGWQKIK